MIQFQERKRRKIKHGGNRYPITDSRDFANSSPRVHSERDRSQILCEQLEHESESGYAGQFQPDGEQTPAASVAKHAHFGLVYHHNFSRTQHHYDNNSDHPRDKK